MPTELKTETKPKMIVKCWEGFEVDLLENELTPDNVLSQLIAFVFHPEIRLEEKRRNIDLIRRLRWEKIGNLKDRRMEIVDHIEEVAAQIGDSRAPIRVDLRFKVFLRDKFTCQYCGVKAPEAELQLDHIQPNVKGGADEEENYITACKMCNIGKKDLWNKELESFKKEKNEKV